MHFNVISHLEALSVTLEATPVTAKVICKQSIYSTHVQMYKCKITWMQPSLPTFLPGPFLLSICSLDILWNAKLVCKFPCLSEWFWFGRCLRMNHDQKIKDPALINTIPAEHVELTGKHLGDDVMSIHIKPTAHHILLCSAQFPLYVGLM